MDEVYTFYQELQGQAFQTTLEDFWKAFQEWAKTPDDSVKQNLVIQKANLFVSRSNAVYTGLSDYQSTINTQISDDIDRINELGNTIFKLNLEIQKVESGNVETAMTLRDERDNALDELASYVDISYKENSDGIVKVSVEGVEFVDVYKRQEDAVKWQKENMRSRFILPVVMPQKVFIITQLIRTVRSQRWICTGKIWMEVD